MLPLVVVLLFATEPVRVGQIKPPKRMVGWSETSGGRGIALIAARASQ
jgi:hypothetical protein